MREARNVFETILRDGHDEDFRTQVDEDFNRTDAPAGSADKIRILAERVKSGYPVWHDDDRSDYSGLVGAIRPRD